MASGDVAHLVERSIRIAEVVSSSLIVSTISYCMKKAENSLGFFGGYDSSSKSLAQYLSSHSFNNAFNFVLLYDS